MEGSGETKMVVEEVELAFKPSLKEYICRMSNVGSFREKENWWRNSKESGKSVKKFSK